MRFVVNAIGVAIVIVALLAAGAVALGARSGFESVGHLSGQMLVHILLMNAVAPLAAFAVGRMVSPGGRDPRGFLSAAMIAQLTVLWAWHSPPALEAVARIPALHLAMQASLFLFALWFWSAVMAVRGDRRWRALLALLLTSKLFCLLGVLLVFAPRQLYPVSGSGHGLGAFHPGAAALDDQQLAGLLMLVACPASYILAGIVIAARWFGAMEEAAGSRNAPPQEPRHAIP